MKKIVLLIISAFVFNAFAAEISKDQASVIGAVVGTGAGMVVGDMLQPYTGQHTKTVTALVGAAVGTYTAQQLHKDAKPKFTKEGKTK
jgi:uncharacterized protein YcfJ